MKKTENMKKRLMQKKNKSMRYFAEIAAAVVLGLYLAEPVWKFVVSIS